MTGFDPVFVRSSISKIQSSYDELMRALATQMQTNFVDSMANYWACNQAQNFFQTAFKKEADELLSNSYKIFESVISAMNQGALSWAQQTNSDWSIVSFNGQLKKINVDNIKENINGIRGVDKVNATATVEKLQIIAMNASSALESAKISVLNCGFIGRNQEEQLMEALNTIKNKINNAIDNLTDSTKRAIDNTISSYGNFTF